MCLTLAFGSLYSCSGPLTLCGVTVLCGGWGGWGGEEGAYTACVLSLKWMEDCCFASQSVVRPRQLLLKNLC